MRPQGSSKDFNGLQGIKRVDREVPGATENY